MIFRFDARKTPAITYRPMDSACTPYISPQHPIIFYFEEIHAD
jgi:hypothetical protein